MKKRPQPSHRPEPAELAEALGKAGGLWNQLVSYIGDHYPPITEAWHFTGPKPGTALRGRARSSPDRDNVAGCRRSATARGRQDGPNIMREGLPPIALGLLLLLVSLPAAAQSPATSRCQPTLAPRGAGPQVADTAFDPPLVRQAFPPDQGPLVLIDEAHFNFHTREGRYAPFARLLTRDGFVVRSLREPWTRAALGSAKILVVANALAERNARGNWTLPTPPAFREAELATVRDWVADGGALLLIADHMPFPGANETLAGAFGIWFSNGFATDSTCSADEFVFRRADGTLADGPMTRGRQRSERIDSVRSFTGQAFRVSGSAQPVLTLGRGSVVLLPTSAWVFSDSTPRLAAEGLLQGAAVLHGKGKVAVFGEAAMFSAQVSGIQRRPMGMNAPAAAQNGQFLLNVMHWLAGLLDQQ